MNFDGQWSRQPGRQIVLRDDDSAESEFETLPSFPPTHSRVLSLNDVNDARIDKPAQAALMRMSRSTSAAAAAASLLALVRQGRIAGIRCINSQSADQRAQRLGSSALNAIAPGENAVLLLEPADLQSGVPLIAFHRALHPGCGLEPGQKAIPAQDAKLDAALVRALANYQTWRSGLQLGRVARAGLNPVHAVNAARTIKLPASSVVNGVLPRLLVQPSQVRAIPGMPVQVRHRHVRRICTLESFEPRDDKPEVDLIPANMTPRFIASDDSVNTFCRLQTMLTDAMVGPFKMFLTPQSVRERKAHVGDRVHVAVVDLTEHKLCRPQFAGFGESINEPGASTAKMLLVYASHQMLFDLQDLARREGIQTKDKLWERARQEWSTFTCKPDIEFLFAIPKGQSAAGVELSAGHVQLLNEVVGQIRSTPAAATLTMKLSFEYIASLAWQSGLRHPQRGGMWFGSTYCRVGDPDTLDPNCHVRMIQGSGCDDGQSRVVWKNDPLGLKSIRGSALSFATQMTLLAQGRLVNADMSRRIESFLVKACSGIAEKSLSGTRLRANKCGVTRTSFHDASLIEHGTTKKHRWVLSYVSEGLSSAERKHLQTLVPAVHNMIVRNNL